VEPSENEAFWRHIQEKYRRTPEVRELLLVRYRGGAVASAELLQKSDGARDGWRTVFQEADAFIGKNGIGKAREGDGKTPRGEFRVLYAFGISENPGTRLNYLPITPTSCACNAQGEFYNHIIDTARTGGKCIGEKMFRHRLEYRYGLAIDYNADCVFGAGSGIFVHCKGEKPHTEGCIALCEAHMRLLLQRAEPGMRVVIEAE